MEWQHKDLIQVPKYNCMENIQGDFEIQVLFFKQETQFSCPSMLSAATGVPGISEMFTWGWQM